MSKDYHDLRICIDCAIYLANGEVPDDDDDLEWKPEDIDKVWPKTIITLGHTFETMKITYPKIYRKYTKKAHFLPVRAMRAIHT